MLPSQEAKGNQFQSHRSTILRNKKESNEIFFKYDLNMHIYQYILISHPTSLKYVNYNLKVA